MKICCNCLQEYVPEPDSSDPGAELGELFLEQVDQDSRYCPCCREILGILNLLGFGE